MDAGNCSMGCHPGLDLTGHLLPPDRGMRLETEPGPTGPGGEVRMEAMGSRKRG